jgi:drug/metabolite transporter (DMT)-like permease
MKNAQLRGYIFATISAVSFGLIPLFILPIKQIGFPMDTTLFYRFFFSSMMVGALMIYRKDNFKINLREASILVVLGLFYAFSSEFLFLGYDYLSAGIASTALFVYPVIVALIMFFVYKEKLSKMSAFSLALAFLGVIVLCVKEGSLDINFIGLGIVLLSALCYALYMVIVNKARLPISGFKLSFYSMIFTSLYYLGKVGVNGETLMLPNYELLLNFLVFALVTTLVSSLALVYAIKSIGSTPTAILGALEPIIAVLISVLMFGEDFTVNLLIGIILILVGVILNIIAENKNQKKSLTT